MCGTNMEDKPPRTLPEGTERINTGTTGTTSTCLHLKLSTVSLTQCSAACDIQDAKPCCWFATTASRLVWPRGASQRLTRTVTTSGPLGPPPVPVPRLFWLARSAHSKQLSNPWLSRADNMHQFKLFFGFGWTSSKIQATLRARGSKRERERERSSDQWRWRVSDWGGWGVQKLKKICSKWLVVFVKFTQSISQQWRLVKNK